MQQSSVSERLACLFRQVSPEVRALLADALHTEVRETPKLASVLDTLQSVRQALGDFDARPDVTLREVLFAPLSPFLVEHAPRAKTRGLIWAEGYSRILTWIERDGAPQMFKDLRGFHLASINEKPQQTALAQAREQLGQHLRILIADTGSGRARTRLTGQIGYDHAVDDLEDFATILRSHQFLGRFAAETLAAAPPDDQVRIARARIERIAAAHPELLPFALRLTRQKMASAPAFVRIAAEAGEGGPADDAIIAPVIELMLAEADAASRAAGAHQGSLPAAIRDFGQAAKALATEIDMVPDGPHARRLAAMRAEFADTIRARLQDISPRVRRLVRPRADERPRERPDMAEMRRLEIDLNTLLVARGFAEEIAINAFTSRACREIRDMLDASTPLLIERMRGEAGDARAAIRARLDVVTRLSSAIYGRDFAMTLQKQVEIASQDVQRPQARSA